MRVLRRRVSDGTRTRDRLDHKLGVGWGSVRRFTALARRFRRHTMHRAVQPIPVDWARFPLLSAPIRGLGARSEVPEHCGWALRRSLGLRAGENDDPDFSYVGEPVEAEGRGAAST
jgi:hypothetical protein